MYKQNYERGPCHTKVSMKQMKAEGDVEKGHPQPQPVDYKTH